MKTIYLCVQGTTLITPPKSTDYEIVVRNLSQVKSIIEDDIYNGHKVIIGGSGNASYHAANLAIKYEKQAYINGETFEFTKNSKSKLSHLEGLLILINQSTQETLFNEVSSKLIGAVIRITPSKYSIEDMRNILSQASPELTLESGVTAKEDIISRFETELKARRITNKERVSFNIDNKSVIELNLSYSEAVEHISNNTGIYIFNGNTGEGKTEKAIKPLLEKFSKKTTKSMFMTSTVLLTNALCDDERNYKKALINNNIKDLNCIVSCLNSALLSPAFKDIREESNAVFIEEYESCRDAILADIIGGKGTLEQKATAQTVFNKLLNKDTVVLTDAHMSQQSIDHIIKRTGKKIFVINPPVEIKRDQKKLTYFVNRNNAVANIREFIDDNKRALTFSDCGHEGAKSKFRKIEFEINEYFDIKNIAVDASYFEEGDNIKYMQNPTDFVNKYDHVLSTSVMRNGISILSGFDLVSMICHQTIAPLDVLQWSDRDRLNTNRALSVNDISHEIPVSYISIFEQELKKGILSIEVDEKRKSLKKLAATKDIIARIKYNNEMRLDYANNLLTMFDLKGYEIEYNYDDSTEDMDKRNNRAVAKERTERIRIYKTLDQLKSINKLNELEAKDESLCTLDEKRIKHASEVFSFYNIDADHEDLKKVFSFDNNGAGRKKINNLSLATYGMDSKYYVSEAKERIFKKLFECLNLDNSLNGEFSKTNYNQFMEFIENGTVSIADKEMNAKQVFNSMFPSIKASSSTWMVKNLLKMEFGLEVENVLKVDVDEKGETVIRESIEYINGKKERIMKISFKTADNLLRFYSMVYPYHNEIDSIKIKGYSAELEANNLTNDYELEFKQDEKEESDNDFYDRILENII